IPARAAALPEGTKTELFAAMEVLKRELPTCELAHETIAVLAGGFERLVSLDQTLGRYCDQYTREHAGELPPEHAQMRKAFQARARATAKVADLIGVMKETMTPEIFKARSPGTTARATY
ncbi:MAG TPA: hypothetical protein VKF62_10650, partial [Planctomycetota bacterium]|nr:hypothetical protein [Planctomycetota bacterium]